MKKITELLRILPVFACFGFALLSCNASSENGENVQDSDSTEVGEENNNDYQTITFDAADGLTVYGNEYKIDDSSPVIVLCHQAQFNKFEYEGTAQRLNDLGFNCIAIDQRSGGPIGIHQNETNLAAVEAGVGVDYLDAIQDISAAVDYATQQNNQDVILWGSSYSSTLVLWEAMSNDKVKAVVSFSPGDYFPEIGSLTDSLANLTKPCFITSADFEVEGTNALLSKMTLGENQIQFAPSENGHHGSRALWLNQNGGEQYWDAITNFLNRIK